MTLQRQPQEFFEYEADRQELLCKGKWTLRYLPAIQAKLSQLKIPPTNQFTINGQELKKLDSAGAWLLDSWQREQIQDHGQVEFKHFSSKHELLLKLIAETFDKGTIPSSKKRWHTLAKIGKYGYLQIKAFLSFLSFVGFLGLELLRILSNPKHFRIRSIAVTIQKDGVFALPIIALLSFLIGVVIAYQLGLQLRNFGANLYIVDLLGLAILREFAPLITAIMVAGRTGSAFTAELGIMKVNQEIDALNTMGVTPAELLLWPRIIGLLIALPLLTIWADIFGVLGGMMMSGVSLNITWTDFLQRFPHVIKLKSLMMGLGKAPVFALIIASIGCFEGMQVKRSSTSLGKNTTRSVVLAIFFIIVADAIFSIIFTKLRI